MSTLPLRGYKIIDATQNVAGPFCTQILADLGADVIKIEPLVGDVTRQWAPPYWNDQSTMFMAFNRSKRSIALDLKEDEGRDLLDRLLEDAAVFVLALRPSTTSRLHLDAESLNANHPDLLVCELTAFGATGPLADRPGFDPLIQSFSGLVSITGNEGSPPVRVATSIMDMGAGMWASIGIISSLLHRVRENGSIGLVQTSLFETSLAWIPYQILGFLASGEAPRQLGSELAMIVPYGAYETSDHPIMIAVGSEKLWSAFCEAIEMPNLACDGRFSSNPRRVKHRRALRKVIEERLSNRTAGAWEAILTRSGIPAAPVNTIPDVLLHPQTDEIGMLQRGLLKDDFPLIGLPLSIDGERPLPRKAPPELGEHTAEILSHDLGLGDEQIQDLRSRGIVGIPGST